MNGGRQGLADLLGILRGGDDLRRLSPDRWEAVIEEAFELRLAGRVAWEAERAAFAPGGWLGERLEGLRIRGDGSDRAIRWEVARLREALRDLRGRVVALKGAAYVLLQLPFARGRRVADVDLLVPERDLDGAESALVAAGWQRAELDPYDDRYYRLWTHELPPLAHRTRLIPVDIHHGLVPRTSRIHPDASRVLAQSLELSDAGVRVPSPVHLVIHAAVHLFHDGEIAGALRDLVDIDGLLRHYGTDLSFWRALRAETEVMGAERSVAYAIRYTHRVLATPIPEDALRAFATWEPGVPLLPLMDVLVERALTQYGSNSPAAALLRARAHWLRMPPMLLTRHLAVKSVRRWRAAFSARSAE